MTKKFEMLKNNQEIGDALQIKLLERSRGN